MASEPKLTSVEEDLLSQLRERGWSLGKPARDDHDLVVEVELDSCKGTVRLMYATEPGREEPAFVRCDLGASETPLTTWSSWEVLGAWEDEADSDNESRFREVGQAAIGPGWCVAGLSIWPDPVPRAWHVAIGRFLARVERLCPAREEQERLAAIDEYPHFVDRARRERIKVIVGVVALAGIGLGAVVLAVLGISSGSVKMTALGVTALVWTVGLAVLLIVLALRDRRNRVGAWDEAVALLRSSQLFDALERGPVLEPWGIPVLRELGEARGLRREPLRHERLRASSSRLGLSAEVRVGRVDFADSTVELCRIVPTAFLSIRFVGSDQQLEGLPPWARTQRTREWLRYTFTDEDVSTGKVEAWLRRALTPAARDAYRETP